MKTPRPVLVPIAFVMILAVVSCGGDDDVAETADTEPAPTTAAPATTEAVPDTTASPPDDTGAPGESDSGNTGVSSVCLDASRAMAEAAESYSSGLAGAMQGTLDDESLRAIADQLRAMAEAAPTEIRDDFQLLAEELASFYETLADSGYEPGTTPSPEQMAELSALTESMDQEAFQEASDNINVWFQENC